jgi:hypothetical protein
VRLRVLALVVLALALAACTTGQVVPPTTESGITSTTQPPASTTQPPPAVDLSATPAGWVPVAYRKAQISVPASWYVLYDEPPCTVGHPPGELFVNPRPGTFHCPAVSAPGPRTTVTFGPATDREEQPPSSYGHRRVINGVSLFPYAAGPRSSYIVPSLGVVVTVDGVLGQRVLHTLTRSPRAVALVPGPAPAVPSNWHSLTFAGLRFSVPAAWPVQRSNQWNVCGPVTIALSESVTLDTDQTFLALPCALQMPVALTPSEGVRLDSGRQGPTGSFSPGGACLHIAGPTACPSSTPDYSILLLRVTVPGRTKPVFVSIGLAGNGKVARTILHSLRAA